MRTNKFVGRNRGWRSRYAGHGFNPDTRQPARYESQSQSQSQSESQNTIQRPPSPPLGPLLQILSETNFLAADQAQSSYGKPAEITNCVDLASFSWLDRDEPTILIPGAPPAWTPLDKPRRLEEDKGDYLRDPNAARFPTYPLEPAVRTLLTEHEGLETQKIDLFACSNTVVSLLRFVRQGEKLFRFKPFRFFVEVVGNTVFFTRHENSPTQLLEGVKGYGHTFPEAYTTWDVDVKGSVSHQRLLRYNFAGLDCILRFECDGFLPSKSPGRVDAPATARDQEIGEGENDLASILDRTKVSSSSAGGGKHKEPLRIEKSGRKVPQEAVFDLKTRANWGKDQGVLEGELPRYWATQIPNFILARHDGGVFNDISVQQIRTDVQKWQAEHQKHLRRLVWLLREIIAAAKKRKDRKLEVRCKSLYGLELREQDMDEHHVLPPELKLRWMGDGASEGKQPESDDDLVGGDSFLAAGSDISDDGRHFSFEDSDKESEKDYTACSADSCGYCGHCSY